MATPEEEDLYKGAPLQVGDEAPNFTCDSHLGMITFHEVLVSLKLDTMLVCQRSTSNYSSLLVSLQDGQFSMLCTFPKDFEAVATTELGMIAKLQEEFEGVSCSLTFPIYNNC